MSQLVDPFVPVNPKSQPGPRQTPRSPRYSMPSSFRRPSRKHVAEQLQQLRPQKPHRPYKNPPPQRQLLANHPRIRRFLSALQYPVIIFGCLVAGIVAQSVVIGQLMLLVYAVIALIFRIDSRTTFLMAFLVLCGVVSLLVFRSNNAMATNFAVYSFVLLLVGVLSLLRELRERYV